MNDADEEVADNVGNVFSSVRVESSDLQDHRTLTHRNLIVIIPWSLAGIVVGLVLGESMDGQDGMVFGTMVGAISGTALGALYAASSRSY